MECYDSALSILANEELYFIPKYSRGYGVFHRVIMGCAPTLAVARKLTKIYKRIIAENLNVSLLSCSRFFGLIMIQYLLVLGNSRVLA